MRREESPLDRPQEGVGNWPRRIDRRNVQHLEGSAGEKGDQPSEQRQHELVDVAGVEDRQRAPVRRLANSAGMAQQRRADASSGRRW